MVARIDRIVRNAICIGALTALCFGCPAAAAGTAEELRATRVSGVVLGPEGTGVQDAFVFVREQPDLCAMTDARGRFVIAGRLASGVGKLTLLASWSGCKPTVVALDTLKADGLELRLEAEDPQWTKLEVGGAYRLTLRNAAARTGIGSRHEDLRPPDEDMEACIAAYDAFRAEKGEVIMGKLLAGEALTEDESPYQYLLYAEIGRRGILGMRDPKAKAYADAFAALEGQAVGLLREKGFVGKPFRADELVLLRRYAAAKGANGYYHVLPSEQVWRKHNLGGDAIQDFRIIPLEQVYKSSNYRRHASLSLTEFLRWEGLAPWLINMGYWNRTGARFSSKTVDELARDKPVSRYEYTLLSEQYGEKPLIVLYVTLEDRAVHDWKVFFKHLFSAYGDRVRFLYIACPSPYWGDMNIDEFAYFGPNPAEAPLKGRACRYGELDFTPERLALSVRKGFMERTWMPDVPMFLEHPGYAARKQLVTAFRSRMTLIDTDGVVAGYLGCYYDYQMRRAFQTYYMPFDKHDVPLASIAPFEKDLRAVLANGGKYDAEKNQSWALATYPSRQLWGSFSQPPLTISRIDRGKGIVKAKLMGVRPESRAYFGIQDGTEGEYTFRFDAGTRFEDWNGGSYKLADVSALKVGGKMYPDFRVEDIEAPRVRANRGKPKYARGHYKRFDLSKYKDKENQAVRIITCDDPNWRPRFKTLDNMMLLSGTIVEKVDGRMAVEMPRPQIADYPGLRFWEEDRAFAKLDSKYATNDIATHSVPILRRWTEAATPTIRYTFATDDAVRIIRDGNQDTEPTKLQVGDRVTVAYGYWWEKTDGAEGIIYPELVLASSQAGDR